jgi:hypothetical protein
MYRCENDDAAMPGDAHDGEGADRMTTQELEAYAQNGTLPRWFQTATLSATQADSQA